MFVDLMTIDLECHNCVFHIPINSPWIEYVGPGMSALDRMFSRLAFHGENNLYQNIGVFWKLRQSSGMAALNDNYEIESLDAESWQQWWDTDGVVKTKEFQPVYDRARWNPWLSPCYARTPDDYTLEGEQTDPTFLTTSGPGLERSALPPVSRESSVEAPGFFDSWEYSAPQFVEPPGSP